MTPLKVIQSYTAHEWEEFILEWAEGFEPRYEQVTRIGGAGDLGRDVIGHIEDPTVRPRPCDVYQCKHYDHPLYPTDAYTELGKLCVHTFRGDYPVPRRYRFAPPRGVGPGLYNLLNYPDKLKKELIASWDKYCAGEISETERFPLEGKLKEYVEAFDLKIVWYLTPQEVLDQHRKTRHWYRRFRIERPTRPPVPPAPEQLEAREQKYVMCLMGAYADRLKKPVNLVEDIEGDPVIHRHFRRSRGHFFSAEALSRFSREQFTPGAFDGVKGHVLAGVEPVSLATHTDSFECVLEVTKQAVNLKLPASDLAPHVGPSDLIGICHHLTNEGELSWCDHARPSSGK